MQGYEDANSVVSLINAVNTPSRDREGATNPTSRFCPLQLETCSALSKSS